MYFLKGVCCDQGSAYVRLFKQISEENLNFLNNRDIQPRFNKVKKVATISMSKSMSVMNIAENALNELLN
jgi:hypothetical protein